jgi:uncharacterized membrane protein
MAYIATRRVAGMTQTRWLAVLAIVGGVVILLLAVYAHPLGLSALPTFGWKKLLASLLGGVAIVAGLLLLRAPVVDEEEFDEEGEEVAPPPAHGIGDEAR